MEPETAPHPGPGIATYATSAEYKMKPGMTPEKLEHLIKDFPQLAYADPEMAALALDNYFPDEMNKNGLYISVAQGFAHKAHLARGEAKGENERSQRYMALADHYWSKTEAAKGTEQGATALRALPRGLDVLINDIANAKDPYVGLFLADNLVPENAKRDAMYAGLSADFTARADESMRQRGTNNPEAQLHLKMAEYCKSKSSYFNTPE